MYEKFSHQTGEPIAMVMTSLEEVETMKRALDEYFQDIRLWAVLAHGEERAKLLKQRSSVETLLNSVNAGQHEFHVGPDFDNAEAALQRFVGIYQLARQNVPLYQEVAIDDIHKANFNRYCLVAESMLRHEQHHKVFE
jgi:hypothetical protein